MFFSDQDTIVLVICLLSGVVFAILGPGRLFKFYIGIILGFLLFLIANLQIKLLSGAVSSLPLSSFESFIIQNKDFVLAFSTALIPVFGIFLTLNESISIRVRGGALVGLLFGIILPLFLLGIFIYILTYSAISLSFLSDILSLFSGGLVFNFLRSHLHYVFYFLLFFLFYKIILTFLFALLGKIFTFLSELFEKVFSRGGDEEENDHHDGHGHGHSVHVTHHGHDEEDDHGHGGHH